MNTDLIKQLELAIAVERGEVPLSEVQWKHRDIKDGKWRVITLRPEEWNYRDYEYRRKPKPLECWVAEYGPGHYKLFWHKEHEGLSRPTDCKEPTRMIKMREVTDD